MPGLFRGWLAKDTSLLPPNRGIFAETEALLRSSLPCEPKMGDSVASWCGPAGNPITPSLMNGTCAV